MSESLSWRLHPYTRHKDDCATILAGRDGADVLCDCGLDTLLYAEIHRMNTALAERDAVIAGLRASMREVDAELTEAHFGVGVAILREALAASAQS